MRRVHRLIAPLLALLLASPAFASEGAPAGACATTPTEGSVPHAANWICSAMKLVTDLELENWVDGIAWAALLAMFVGRTLMISLDANAGPKLRDFLITAAFAFGLMLTLTPIREATFTVWRESYIWSHGKGTESTVRALTEIVETIDSHTTAEALVAGTSATAFTGLAGAGTYSAVATPAQKAATISRIVNTTRGAGKLLKNVGILRVIDLVLIPIFSLQAMIVFGGALAVIVGSLVLPIGSVMMVSGNGAGFFSVWSKVQLGSILTMVVFPLMFGLAINVAVTRPLSELLTELQTINAEYETAMAELEAEKVGFFKNPANAISQVFEGFSAKISTAFAHTMSVIEMVMQLIIGAIVGIGLIFLLQTLIQRFIAGIGVQGRNLAQTFGLFKGGGGQKGAKQASPDGEPESVESSPVRRPARGLAQAMRGSSGGSGGGGGSGDSGASAEDQGTGPKTATVEPLPHETPATAGAATGSARGQA